MRLDLFLKVGRLIKRRALAQKMCGNGRVLVNGQEAKPAKDVRQGDVILLKFSSRTIMLEVLTIPASAKMASAEGLYKVVSDIRSPNEKDQWNENL